MFNASFIEKTNKQMRTKMRIKISETNAERIEAALLSANGKARGHTYTKFNEIKRQATVAESMLASAHILKKDRKGITATAQSGDKTSASYSYARKATTITLERGVDSWFLIAAEESKVYPEGGKIKVNITEKLAVDSALNHLKHAGFNLLVAHS